MTLKAFNVWVIYQINALEHSHPWEFKRDLNVFWYDLPYGVIVRDKVENFGPFFSTLFWNESNNIYSDYFSLNSLFKACSFSRCRPMKYTLCFQRASWAKRWNMTTKIVENEAGSSQVDQFAVVTARPRLGTWLVVTSRVEGTRYVCCLVSKECRIKAKEKKVTV